MRTIPRSAARRARVSPWSAPPGSVAPTCAPPLCVRRRSVAAPASARRWTGCSTDARASHSGVLVLRGEAGVGKTALLQLRRRPGRRASGSCRSPASSPRWSCRSRACTSSAGRCSAGSTRCPQPQQEALRVSFGLASGAAPDRFLVGLAALTLLAEVAETRAAAVRRRRFPVARRGVGAGARVRGAPPARRARRDRVRRPRAEWQCRLAGLPELRLDGLDHEDASALLATVVAGRLDEHVRERIIAETRGNPLALLELPRGDERRGAGRRLRPSRPRRSLEDSFQRRLEPLPARHPPAPAARGRRSRRRAVAGVARGRAARHRPRTPRRRPPTPGCSRSARRCGSAIPRCARRRTARPRRRNGSRCTPRWPTPPIPQLDPDRRAWHRAQATPAPDEQRRRGAGALGRPRAGARRRRGRRRLPRDRGHAHAGARGPRAPAARRGAREARRGRARRGAGAAGRDRGRPGRRAAGGRDRAAAGRDRVRPAPRRRGGAAAHQRGAAPGLPRRRRWRAPRT